jgi:hypothetical protein
MLIKKSITNIDYCASERYNVFKRELIQTNFSLCEIWKDRGERNVTSQITWKKRTCTWNSFSIRHFFIKCNIYLIRSHVHMEAIIILIALYYFFSFKDNCNNYDILYLAWLRCMHAKCTNVILVKHLPGLKTSNSPVSLTNSIKLRRSASPTKL